MIEYCNYQVDDVSEVHGDRVYCNGHVISLLYGNHPTPGHVMSPCSLGWFDFEDESLSHSKPKGRYVLHYVLQSLASGAFFQATIG